MTSLLASNRTVRRETATTYRGRALVVELHPGYLSIRQKGKRTPVTVDYAAIFELGWKMIARAQRAEQQAARKKQGGKYARA